MSKTIATENAPAAIGPYVQGVDLGNMIIIRSDPGKSENGRSTGRRRCTGTSVAG